MEDNKGMTALQYAVKGNNTEIVQLLLLHEDTDPMTTDKFGKNVLHNDYITNANESLKAVLSHITSPLIKFDNQSLTMIHTACIRGNDNVVQFFLSLPNIDHNMHDRYGRTSLQVVELLILACSQSLHSSEKTYIKWKQKYEKISNILRGESVMSPVENPFYRRYYSWSAPAEMSLFHYSAMIGDDATLRFLFSNHIFDVNSSDSKGTTPLSLVANNGSVECMKVLLSAEDIAINAQGSDSWTALHTVAFFGYSECMKLLLRHPHINVNMQTKFGETALHIACENRHPECVKLLLAHKDIDLSLVYRNGYKPIHLAADAGLVEMLRDLLTDCPTNINIQDNDGYTPLHLAARKGNTKCVQLLLAEKGIEVNIKDSNGCTPLHLAARHNNADCMQYLLENKDIYVNVRNTDGNTPLHLAGYEGHTNCVRLLLEHKDINVNTNDNNGKTPLRLVTNLYIPNQEDIIELLQQHGATE